MRRPQNTAQCDLYPLPVMMFLFTPRHAKSAAVPIVGLLRRWPADRDDSTLQDLMPSSSFLFPFPVFDSILDIY